MSLYSKSIVLRCNNIPFSLQKDSFYEAIIFLVIRRCWLGVFHLDRYVNIKIAPQSQIWALQSYSYCEKSHSLHLFCKGRSLRISSRTKFFVNHIQAITIVLNHLNVVDNGLNIFFFFNLFVNEPL